jgi:lipoyl(octanoyl) transferase
MESATNQTLTQPRICEVQYLGRVSYAEGLTKQADAVEQLKEGLGNEQLFLLEHNHVFTLGRSAKTAHILASQDYLDAQGIEVHDIGRGGDVTYHGEGQLVGYPIINLKPDRQDVHRYVRDLEEVLMRTVAEYDIEGRRIKGLTGVWVGNEKIAAIGVRIARWITSHGFALNVSTDLKYFQMIVPCGITDKGVTSIEKILGKKIALQDVAERTSRHFATIFERHVTEMGRTFKIARIEKILPYLFCFAALQMSVTHSKVGAYELVRLFFIY